MCLYTRVAMYLTVTHSTVHRIESCETWRAFLEQVGPRILLLESIDYFGASDYFSDRKKEQLS